VEQPEFAAMFDNQLNLQTRAELDLGNTYVSNAEGEEHRKAEFDGSDASTFD